MTESAAQAERYDFCLSFASEQRSYVEEVAQLLRDAGVRVFYDSHETANLLGVDLYAHLDQIYNRGSRYCVLFASEAYAHKVWTSHERMSAQDRALRSTSDYVLPVRFDDTEIPGLRGTIGYADARVTSPAGLVQLLLTKLDSGSAITSAPASVLVLATDVRAELGDILREALYQCGVSVPAGLVSGTPTRAFAVVKESAFSAVNVTTTLVAEVERLAHANPDMKLRIAVHRGDVPTERIAECVDVTTAIEAAVSSAVTEVFDLVPDADCVVVVTQRVYDSIVRPGKGGSNPRLFTPMTTVDGSGLHVRVPGYPRLPDRSDRAQRSVASQPSVGKLNYFAGDVRTEHLGDNYYGADDGRR